MHRKNPYFRQVPERMMVLGVSSGQTRPVAVMGGSICPVTASDRRLARLCG